VCSARCSTVQRSRIESRNICSCPQRRRHLPRRARNRRHLLPPEVPPRLHHSKLHQPTHATPGVSARTPVLTPRIIARLGAEERQPPQSECCSAAIAMSDYSPAMRDRILQAEFENAVLHQRINSRRVRQVRLRNPRRMVGAKRLLECGISSRNAAEVRRRRLDHSCRRRWARRAASRALLH